MTQQSPRKATFQATLLLMMVGLLAAACTPPPLDYLRKKTYAVRSGFGGRDLHFLLVYDGFFADPPQFDQGVEKLRVFCTRGDEVFVFGPSSFLGTGMSAREIEEDMAEANPEERKEYPKAYRLGEFAVDHIEVRTAGLFENSETGRLSGYQIVRVERVEALVRLANKALCEWGAEGLDEAEKQEDSPWDESSTILRSAALWKELAEKGAYQILSLEGTALSVHIPTHPDEAAEMRRIVLDEMLFSELWEVVRGQDELTTDSLRQVTEFLSDHPISVVQETDAFHLTFGAPDAEMNQIVMPLSDDAVTSYSNNLIDWAREQEFWLGELDNDEIVREFRESEGKVFKALPRATGVVEAEAEPEG